MNAAPPAPWTLSLEGLVWLDGMSVGGFASYRDSLRLLLCFANDRTGIAPSALGLALKGSALVVVTCVRL